MPNDNDKYLIQSPKGETLSAGQKAKLQSALNKVGTPSKDWRFVVLPDQDWKDMTASSPLPHPTDTTFSNLPGKVTYINQSLLQKPDDEITRLMAHEQGHARLNTSSEDKANDYMRNSMAEIQKYGRSNNAANQDLQSRVASEAGQMQPVSAPIATELHSPHSLMAGLQPSSALIAPPPVHPLVSGTASTALTALNNAPAKPGNYGRSVLTGLLTTMSKLGGGTEKVMAGLSQPGASLT